MKNAGYLDFHTHILPGIDDGAKDWDMTRQMLREAHRQGINKIIATPHNYPNQKKQDNRRIRELCREADQIAKEITPAMEVLPGNEIYFRWGIIEELRKGHVMTMADSSYLLIEFSPEEIYERMYHGLKELIEAGYYPVLAHMERVHTVFRKKKHLEELVKLGCYMQVNCGSLMGGMFDKEAALLRKYMEHGYIHFLGSDCHNMTGRKPLMEGAVAKLGNKLREEVLAKVVFENPARFLKKKFI